MNLRDKLSIRRIKEMKRTIILTLILVFLIPITVSANDHIWKEDKSLHLICGTVGYLSLRELGFTEYESAGTMAAIGIFKELIWDKGMGRGNSEFLDLWAMMAGLSLGLILEDTGLIYFTPRGMEYAPDDQNILTVTVDLNGEIIFDWTIRF